METLRFIDLFCGIGGFRLGLERANKKAGELKSIGTRQVQRCNFSSRDNVKPNGRWGESKSETGRGLQLRGYRCVWSSDIDKYARQIYEKNFGEEPEGDITRIPAESIPDHDLFCAGFPCQSFSIAGKRRGIEDARGSLFFEICKVLRAKKTKYVLLENVKGLLSVPYVSMEEVVEPETISVEGTDRWGEKHIANRYTGRWCRVTRPLPIPGTGGWVFATMLQSLDELGYDLQWQVLNSKHFGVPQNRERVFIIGHLRKERRPEVFPIGEGNGIFESADEGKQGNGQRVSSTIDSRYGTLRNAGETYILKELTKEESQGQRVYDPLGLAIAVSSQGGGQGAKTGLYNIQNQRKKNRNGEYLIKKSAESNTLGTRNNANNIEIGFNIRRLTPIECERLQGFPDNWTQGVSDTQRYKLLGNAVTVNVVKWLGERLIDRR